MKKTRRCKDCGESNYLRDNGLCEYCNGDALEIASKPKLTKYDGWRR